jgi:GNAT superfamily N-acetyltransferase
MATDPAQRDRNGPPDRKRHRRFRDRVDDHAPPVYAPGGPTALIDDFTVADPAAWDSVGGWLFEAVRTEAAKRGAVGIVSIRAHKDERKRSFLSRLWTTHRVRVAFRRNWGAIASAFTRRRDQQTLD